MRRLLSFAAALVLVLTGVVILASPANAEPVELAALADGDQEAPGPGDDDGIGFGELTVDDETDEFCYAVTAFDITLPAAAMHIHEAPEGVAGPIVITLDETAINSGPEQICLSIDAALADDIAAAPGDYYLNIHNADFPDGAVRGQLQAPPEPVGFEAVGDGAEEVPGPGDPDGTVTAIGVAFEENSSFCIEVSVTNITLPAVAMHIHEAPAGVAGDVVITLDPATVNTSEPSCAKVDLALLADISATPAAYYLNVHTADYPDGAVRGQLAFLGEGQPPTTDTTAPPTTAALPQAVPAGSGGEAADPASRWDGSAIGLIGTGVGLALVSTLAWRRRSGHAGSA